MCHESWDALRQTFVAESIHAITPSAHLAWLISAAHGWKAAFEPMAISLSGL